MTNKKNAAKKLLTMWGTAVAQNDLAAFEEMFGPLQTHTPPRGKKRTLEHTPPLSDDDSPSADDGQCPRERSRGTNDRSRGLKS